MSIKTELLADLRRIGYQLGGAHLTRDARSATFTTFSDAMRELGYGIRAAHQIGGRHLQAFAQHRAAYVGHRTLANELSHLRRVLEHIGKQGLARNPAYSNRALGIEPGSRVGTKLPLPDAVNEEFARRMAQLGRPGIGCVLQLQRALGLREMEAIRSGHMPTLARWQRELQERGCVRIIEGTKGGRPREIHPADIDRALATVKDAQAVLEATRQQFLVARADGTATTDLRQALNVYRNVCHRAGIQTHRARYAFAQERMRAYIAEGYSEREARAATSLDLGHGDGRGHYVASVYARGA
jgi:hypothetical protein